MYRVGIIKVQDTAKGRVRVAFPDRDQMESWWLPVIFAKTQNDKLYWMPDLGEQVICLMDEYDEDGVVVGSIYSSADTPPVTSADKLHWTSKDGATFEYDRAVHALQMTIPSGGTVTISANGASLAIDSTGNVEITAIGQILLAGGGPGVARIGDATICPAGTGHIASGSLKVSAG
jgi:phage baseplate assembly protein V